MFLFSSYSVDAHNPLHWKKQDTEAFLDAMLEPKQESHT